MPSRSSLARVARSITGRQEADVRSDDGSIGVVFVHGIGNQPPRETLLNWANPIVEMLAEWRRERDESASGHAPIGEDPVETAGVEPLGGTDERRLGPDRRSRPRTRRRPPPGS